MSIANLLSQDIQKEWAKLYCKEINAEDMFIENLETNNLKVDVIEEKTPANNIRIVNKIQLDCMVEDTPLNGVICESILKTNELEPRTGSEIVCGDLRVENLLSKVDRVNIENNQAFDLSKNYIHVDGSFNAVAGGNQKLATLIPVNFGDDPYTPEIQLLPTKAIIFKENGVYNINVLITPTNAFLTNQQIYFKFHDVSDTSTKAIELIQFGTGSPGSTTAFTMSGSYVHIAGVNKEFEFEASLLNGAGTSTFDIRCYIIRIK